jgi:hypothetical protein
MNQATRRARGSAERRPLAGGDATVPWMVTMTEARCPKCKIEVGATWRWCLACGYDPDGSANRVRQAAIEARQREGGWLPVIIVLVGLSIGGVILWRTTPDDTSLPTVAPSTAAEVTSWTSFTPPSGGFAVDLPGPPTSSTPGPVTPSGRPLETFAVGAAGHLFSVNVVDTRRTDLLPGKDEAAVQSVLHGYAAEVAGALSGELGETTPTTAGGAPGLDFRVDHGALGELQGRVMLVGTRLCSVAVTSRELSDDITEHVFDSFVTR